MARAATSGRSKARRKEAAAASVGAVLVQECVGLALLGLAMLAALAVYTYDPTDPVLAATPVNNAGGVIGAALASALVRSVGYGALLLIGAVAVVGARLTAGRGLPRLASRFWAGAPLLLAASASLPPLLSQLSPERIQAEGGWLGSVLVAQESWLLGVWGAVLLNAVLLGIGVLVSTGLSTSRVLAVVGVGIGWLLGGLGAVVQRAGEVALDALSGARRGVVELARG
ncbi:MAG: DNA translocase FtsK 4TM domain-containing protein, partial [Myxococcota bacterium]